MNGMQRALVSRPARARRLVGRLDLALAGVERAGLYDALEIGCGAGHAARHLRDRYGLRVRAVDIDPDQVALARRRHGEDAGLRFGVADATALAMPDAAFDLVVAQDVLHHIPRWGVALAEVARVLRPGGVLIWQDFTVSAWCLPLLRPLARHAGVYTLVEVRRQLASHGVHQRAHERFGRLLAERHHLVMQKLTVHGTLPQAS